MKMKWNFAFTRAVSLKLHALAKLRSTDSCQNGTCEDHYQITNNVGSNNDINPPLQPRLTLAVISTFTWKFAILMKFNWKLSNYSLRWPSSPHRVAGSGIGPLKGAMSPVAHVLASENKLKKDGPSFTSSVGDFGRLFLAVEISVIVR